MTTRQLNALDRKMTALLTAANSITEDMRLNGSTDDKIAQRQALFNEWEAISAKWRAGNPAPRSLLVD